MGKFNLSAADKKRMAAIAKGAQYPSEREKSEASQVQEEVVLERKPLSSVPVSPKPSAASSEQTAGHAEAELSFPTVIPPTGREVATRRIRVEANETTLWEGNPRNFAEGPIDNLLPLIQATNGNTVPIFARYDSEGRIQVIAGSRRRRACMELNKLLTVDIIECTDYEADAISYMENEGRLDVDAFSNGQFLLSRFNIRKKEDPSLNVGQFANNFGVERETMSRYLSIGKLPTEFKTAVKDHSTFGRNACLKLMSAYKKASEDLSSEEVIKRVERGAEFKDCPSLIHFIKKLVQAEPELKIDAPKSWSLNESKVSYKMKKNGARVFELDANISAETLRKIEELLEKPE